MPSLPRLVLPAVASAWLAACGSRSTLQDEDGATAAGGGSAGATSATSATSTTSSSTTSTGSGVGGAPACDDLFLSGNPITSDAPLFEMATRPRLVPATDGGKLVSVVLARQLNEGPTWPPTRIVHAQIEPWDVWPESLGAEYQVCSFGGDAFEAAPALPAEQPGFATLFYLPTGQFPSDMYLAPAVSPGASYDPFPQGTQWDAWEPAWGVALARGSAGHLAAHEYTVGNGPNPPTFLDVALVDAATPGVTVVPGVTCANTPFPAAAVPTSGGFLVATAAGRAFGACFDDDGAPGPADEVQVIRVDQASGQLTLSASFQDPDPIAHLALAGRADGAWLVWQNNGQSALQPPPVQAVRLDASGAVAGSIFQVTKDGETDRPFAAAALGPWLAVAWIAAFDASASVIHVDLFDESGAFVIGTSITTAPFGAPATSLSLLASPGDNQLLLAWAGIVPSPSVQATLQVARISCAKAL
jgi:hypothetical protein